MVRKFPPFRPERKKRSTSEGTPQFPNGISGKLPYHLGSNRDFRSFWPNGKHPWTWGAGAAVTLLPEKKLHNARKHVLYKRTQIAVKAKTFIILTSNERIIIPKLQLNPDFSNL